MTEAAPPLSSRELCKNFIGGDGTRLDVLQDIDLDVGTGEAIAITGVSGAGKSTLLHLLGALDRPSSGQVLLGGQSVADFSDEELAVARNRHVGLVFQFHHLLREFTALENVMMPALLGGAGFGEARKKAGDLLEEVGVAARASHKPSQLSGGEQQRVAVARALVNEPLVLLADEPSGNLDAHTSDHLHDLLFRLRDTRRLSMVIVTHNPDLAHRADRILVMSDGRLQPPTQV
jgi:lipoprotein-releasing system ATP-binding protein